MEAKPQNTMALKTFGSKFEAGSAPSDAKRQAYMSAFRNVSPLLVDAQGSIAQLQKAVSTTGVATVEEMRMLNQAEQSLRMFIKSIVGRNGR